MAPSLTATLPEFWKYVSEGGATIVFDYTGPPNPQLDGTVLRLRKSPISTPPSPPELVVEEPDDPMIEFQQKCMERLIPSEHLPRLVSVGIDRLWLERLGNYHDSSRPIERRTKDQIDLTRTKGVLATDLVGGDWLAVEIKPKWAFLPSPIHLSDATRAIKTRTCRFCMHSRMRAESSEKPQSVALGFCPLDLFSREEDRVRTAVHSLWDAWVQSNGTINNLKLFSQGIYVLPSNISAILSNGVDQVGLSPSDLREAFTSAMLPILMNTPVLRILSKLQRELDALDMEGLSKLLRASQASNAHPFPDPTIPEWTEFLDRYLSSASKEFDHANPVPEDLRYYLLAYLLSATFKDCSLIVRLNLLGASHPFSPNSPEQVTVIDLDPKSLDRLQKWEKMDREIVEANLAIDSINPKICIDRWLQ